MLKINDWVLLRRWNDESIQYIGQISRISDSDYVEVLVEVEMVGSRTQQIHWASLFSEIIPLSQVPYSELGIYLTQLEPLSAAKLRQLIKETGDLLKA